jgi:O-antigen/teichoic acid export membrane protein
MSVVLVINSFGLVQNVLLRKALDFKTETKVSLVASLFSGIIGVTMAYCGFGVWSLIGQQLSAALFRTSLLWFFTSWRPIWVFSLKSLKSMFGFGSKVLCSSLLDTIFDNLYYLIIGKLFSPASLGFYARADNLQKLPSMTLSRVILRVTLPVFSMIQGDQERVKRGMKKALMTLALVNFPLMIGLAIVARPIVLVLLTEKWAHSIPYLQLLCVVGLMCPLQGANLNILTALGRSDLYLRVQTAIKLLIAINIAITWRWGIMAMITGQLIISFFSYFLNAYYNKKLLNYSFLEQVKDIFPYFMNALLMGAGVYSINYMPIQNQIILLVIQILTGGTIYILLCQIFRLSVFLEFQQMAVKRLSFKTA